MADYQKTGLLTALKAVADSFRGGEFDKNPNADTRSSVDAARMLPGKAGGAADTNLRRMKYDQYRSTTQNPMSWEDWHQTIFGEPPPDLGQDSAGLASAQP